MRHHNQEPQAVTNHGKNNVVLGDSPASTPYHQNFDLAGVLPTPCTGNSGSAHGPGLPLLVSPEQLAESWEDSYARRRWWQELHTSRDLLVGTTFSDLNDAVEAVQTKGDVPLETSTPMQRGPFLCPVNSAECDYPSCVIAGSPFATDSCIARQMELKTPVSDYLEAL